MVVILCALLWLPRVLALVSVGLYVGLTGVLAIAVWRGRGWLQAFAVGAILPHVAGYLVLITGYGASQLTLVVASLTVASFVAGVAAAAWNGFLARSNGKFPVPDLPYIRDWFANQ